MAASEALLGYGTIYAIDDGTTGTVFTPLGEVFDFEPPADEVEEVDVTHYLSPDRTREFIAGLINPGEGTFSINWIPGNDTDIFLRDLYVSGETRNHKVTFTNGASMTFPAFIKGFAPTAPVDDKMTAQFTIKKAGAVTWVDPV
jgi:predicted secreted protein